MFHLKIFQVCYSIYLYKRCYAKHVFKLQFKSKRFRKLRTRILDFIDIFYLSYIFYQFNLSNNFLLFMRTYFK